VLPPGARAGSAGRTHAAHPRGACDARDREGVPRPRGHAGAAARTRQAEDPRRRNPVPRAPGRGAPGAAGRGAASPVPDLQRGLQRDRRRRPGAP
jgi:hypothetical protein